MRVQRLGILGGTFDPVHYGHLVMGNEAHVRMELDRVLFVPAGQPPHKMHRRVSNVQHRLEMVQLAIRDNPAFELSTLDIDRPGPSYTVELLELLHVKHDPVELYFIVGMDSLEEIMTWKEPARILQLVRIISVPRPGYTPVHTKTITDRLSVAEDRIQIIQMPQLSISSTELQRRVALHLPLRYLVPPRVEEYINEHRLYR